VPLQRKIHRRDSLDDKQGDSDGELGPSDSKKQLQLFLVRTKLRVAAEKVRQSVAVLRAIRPEDDALSEHHDPAERDAHGHAAEPVPESAPAGTSTDLTDDIEQEALEVERRRDGFHAAAWRSSRRLSAEETVPSTSPTAGPLGSGRRLSVDSPTAGRRFSVESLTAVGHKAGAQLRLLPEVPEPSSTPPVP